MAALAGSLSSVFWQSGIAGRATERPAGETEEQKKTIGLTTNVIWDAQIHYDDTIFPSMMEWVYETLIYFSKNQHYNLLIRVHPTEIKSDRPARQKVKESEEG